MDLHYTLVLKNNAVFIDCVYANIIFSDYSLAINRAVCGLDKKLTNDYTNIIYEFSDKWEDDISKQVNNTTRLKTANVLLG